MESLYERTLKKLLRDNRTVDEIADGAGVNKHWLSKFRQGAHPNPGVNTVERLYRFLSTRKQKAVRPHKREPNGRHTTAVRPQQ